MEEGVRIGKKCNREQRRKIMNIVRKYRQGFGNKLNADTFENDTEHVISIWPGAKPSRRRMPFLHPKKQEILDNMVRDLHGRDMVERGESEWRAPLLVIPKPGGGWRTVVDYRGLNAQTIPESYPLPRIDEILGRLKGAKFFSKIDLTEGFWNIRLAKESRHLTGFAVKGGTYVWKRMPMGLKNSPATFQRVMEESLGEFQDFAQPYIDDVIIFSKTFEEHLEHIEKVLRRLGEKGLLIKLPKCEFCTDEIEFLGHVVNERGVRMQGGKTDAIMKMPIPTTGKEVKRFLGMVGFYRNYIPNLAKRTAELTKLTAKRFAKKIEWNEILKNEFEDVKQAMMCDPVMAFPDFEKEFIVTTDASKVGMGATLSQMYENGERVIAYASRCTTPAEKNYGITQLEAAGVVWAVEKWKNPYLDMRKFTIITDHEALVKIFGNAKGTTGNNQLDRWSLKLSDLPFEIIHRAGSTLTQVDHLSRLPIDLNVMMILGLKPKKLAECQREDEMWGAIIKK